MHGIKRRVPSFNIDRIDYMYQWLREKNLQIQLHAGGVTNGSDLIRIVQQVQSDEIYNLAAQNYVVVSS